MASSSAVLIPATTAARIFSRAACTTSPAARIFTSCSGVLYWISRSLLRTLSTVRAQRVNRSHRDVFHKPGRIDADQLALRAVEVDQRRGLVGVFTQPVRDRLGLVVIALIELAAAPVAHAIDGRRIEFDVPGLAASRAR